MACLNIAGLFQIKMSKWHHSAGVLIRWQQAQHSASVSSVSATRTCKVQEEGGGKYKLNKQGIEFSRYLEDEGWHIIPIKAADQLVGL